MDKKIFFVTGSKDEKNIDTCKDATKLWGVKI